MRILHVLAERGFSGGENQLRATLRYLKGQGHEQILAMSPRGQFRSAATELDVPIVDVDIRNNYDVFAARRLRRVYREVAPELIHLSCSRSHKVGSLAGAFGGSLPPKVVTRRMDYPIKNNPFSRWIYGSAVAAVVAISEGVREAILRIGIDPAHVHLINEGVETGRFAGLREPARRAAARANLGLEATDIFGVTMASLHIRKAHDVLLEALSRVQLPEGQRIVWLFGGDGPEREALRKLAAAMPAGVEVRIPGQIDNVLDALAAADMFCLPSRYEGLGVALLEALASGAPCIASRVGGMREVIEDGESGLHVEVEDVAGLTAAIQRLVDDPAYREGLGRAGLQRARERFDVSLMGEKTEALYARVVGQS